MNPEDLHAQGKKAGHKGLGEYDTQRKEASGCCGFVVGMRVSKYGPKESN
jgi:hypothetical protein